MMFPAPNRDENERRNAEWLLATADSPGVREILNLTLLDALKAGEDIYLQQRGTSTVLIFEGVERREQTLSHNVVAPLLARLKIMADLDPNMTHAAQEGSFRLEVQGTPLDVSVRFEPMLLGEELSLQIIRTPRAESGESL